MTCIVGVVDKGSVVIGGDTLGSNGQSKDRYANHKVFRRDGIVVGYTTTYRFGQLLEFGDALGELRYRIDRHSMDPLTALVKHFVPALRGEMDRAGAMQKDSNVEHGGNCLIGMGNRLFELQADFSVLESADGYMAVGSGENFARGALAASTGTGMARCLSALRAAAKHNPYVGAPFVIIDGAGAVYDADVDGMPKKRK